MDVASGTVVVGTEDELLTTAIELTELTWTGAPVEAGAPVEVQTSAHGTPAPATLHAGGRLELVRPQRRVAPGQTVALYRGDVVLGAGLAT